MAVRSSWILAWLCQFVVLSATVEGAAPAQQRWLYLQQNLQVTENIPKVELLLRRAAKVGYNGVVLADYKLNILDRVPQHYFKNAERFKDICRELKLEIIPAVMSFGYSDGILAHDPDLAEALPVENAPFVVQGQQIVPRNAGKNLVPGEFEQFQADTFAGWSFQDEPGAGTFSDVQIRHGGKASLRIDNPPGSSGNRRVNKRLKVRPWTQFHTSAWIRTQEFSAAGSVRMFAIGANGRVLSHSNLSVQKNQEWTQHHVIFNSLENSEVQFYVGVWGCETGKLWLDDVLVTEEPFVNLVRRSDCPLVIRDSQGGATFVEGTDFEELRDPKLGSTPWAGSFDVYHEPPRLKLATGTRLQEGQQVLINYYHAVTIYDNQVPCSLTSPRVFEIVEDQVRRVEKLFQPQTYFLSHDEIRVANWSQTERTAGQPAGLVLADNVRQCVKIIRKINAQARLCIWSDMFDPHHNAVQDFYLVNGDLNRSWEGLPPDMLIINWNSGKPDKSLPFFDRRGHSQVLAGYYDSPPENIRRWQSAAKDLKGVQGAMYTTWRSNFDDLEKFAELAWGGVSKPARD